MRLTIETDEGGLIASHDIDPELAVHLARQLDPLDAPEVKDLVPEVEEQAENIIEGIVAACAKEADGVNTGPVYR